MKHLTPEEQHIHDQVIETMGIIEDLTYALANEPAISSETRQQLVNLAVKIRAVKSNSVTVTTTSTDPAEKAANAPQRPHNVAVIPAAKRS